MCGRSCRVEMTARQYWVHTLISQRLLKGQLTKIYHDMRSYRRKFFNYFRISSTSFDELLRGVGSKITCQPTNMRTPVSPEERFAVTLRYGNPHCYDVIRLIWTVIDAQLGSMTRAMGFWPRTHTRGLVEHHLIQYCCGGVIVVAHVAIVAPLDYVFILLRKLVLQFIIVKTTRKAAWDTLLHTCLAAKTDNNWEVIAGDFYNRTNFRNCVGAVNGEAIHLVSPKDSSSLYYNHK
ncbi:hypothetical protein PR048_001398 [Dryococelus australis]|uniref:Uncharacterized protein n=1 Tax=Dryococelus australis TaxID=614101 RepID=A0ABQ9IH96_9NEOP|nr:hypothetical protein PR048_001398 [Dryococelus australis]